MHTKNIDDDDDNSNDDNDKYVKKIPKFHENNL